MFEFSKDSSFSEFSFLVWRTFEKIEINFILSQSRKRISTTEAARYIYVPVTAMDRYISSEGAATGIVVL